MTTHIVPPPAVNARSVLLPYLLGLAAAMLLIQAAIALTGGEVGLLAGTLTAAAAAGVAAWMVLSRRKLLRIRFGFAVAHAIAFAAVTTSFNAHAVLRAVSLGSSGGEGAVAQELLATPWFGATLLMSAAWGLGLLIHLTGSVLGRGWED
ncbi:hypothetical protein [Arthrobacter sp. Z1-15]